MTDFSDVRVTQAMYIMWYLSGGGTLSCRYHPDDTPYDFRRNGRLIDEVEFDRCFAPRTLALGVAPALKDLGRTRPASDMPIDFARGPV